MLRADQDEPPLHAPTLQQKLGLGVPSCAPLMEGRTCLLLEQDLALEDRSIHYEHAGCQSDRLLSP